MPNQHDPAKRTLAVYLSREKYYKIKRLAAKHHISMSGLLEILIDRAVCDIELLLTIMATVRRLAKASGKTEEVFLRQYLIECMKEENEALENYNNSNKTQPNNPEPAKR